MSALAHGGLRPMTRENDARQYPSRVSRISPTSHHSLLPGDWLPHGDAVVDDDLLPFGIGVALHPRAMVVSAIYGEMPDEDLLPWERAARESRLGS